jgi:two-component system response regulator DevR
VRTSTGPASILVVDDDPEFLAAATSILHEHGLTVVGEAGTAAAAMAAALELEPDAVLVDVGLPDQDGVVLAGRLAALPWRPTVLLTSADPDAAGDMLPRGVSGFLHKSDLYDAPLARIFGSPDTRPD